MNLWQRIFSISSACLIANDTRTELTEPSMRHRSWSVRAMVIGLSSNSLLPRTSTSGLLCLSTSCDGKFLRQRAASSVERTVLRYLRCFCWASRGGGVFADAARGRLVSGSHARPALSPVLLGLQ